jgi:thiol-disulfide isomerase/thioredoxin
VSTEPVSCVGRCVQVEVSDTGALLGELARAKDRLVVVYFFSATCHACALIRPLLGQLAQDTFQGAASPPDMNERCANSGKVLKPRRPWVTHVWRSPADQGGCRELVVVPALAVPVPVPDSLYRAKSPNFLVPT